ncbi:thyroid hormone receptor-associated protein 3-like [Sesbania bispinosa]|nr:thyroid hormone receptor-associated protein 3-like [Sesbania bispinosa]
MMPQLAAVSSSAAATTTGPSSSRHKSPPAENFIMVGGIPAACFCVGAPGVASAAEFQFLEAAHLPVVPHPQKPTCTCYITGTLNASRLGRFHLPSRIHSERLCSPDPEVGGTIEASVHTRKNNITTPTNSTSSREFTQIE